jgi:cysteinyl-tRNA synthetase
MPEAEALVTEAREALADDFNTPVVKASLHAAATLANKLVEGKGISVDKQVRRRTAARLAKDIRRVGEALGILANDPRAYLAGRRDRLVGRKRIDTARVTTLIADRDGARKAKDYKRGDEIRDELKGLGIEVLDTPQGTDWRVLDDAT